MSFARPTSRERTNIRASVYTATPDERLRVVVWDNADGTVAADIAGVVFEAGTFGELFREIAAILEEG